MKLSCYLCIKDSRKYGCQPMRITKTTPYLEANEIAIKLNIEIPDAIFKKPTLEASVKVPESAVSKPVIEADVTDNIEKIIKQNTGIDVKLSVVPVEDEE